MKFGTDTGEYGKLSLKFIICFYFQVMPFDDYVTLHKRDVSIFNGKET